MTSQLNVDTIANKAGSGTVTLTKQIAAKSYVNVNGDANPPTIRDTLNVASLTDVSAGQIFYNLTNSMSSGDYCRLVSAGDSGVRRVADTGAAVSNTTTIGIIITEDFSGNLADCDDANGAMLGDLA